MGKIIAEETRKGVRQSELMIKCPGCWIIQKQARFRPPRVEETFAALIHGPPGIGKTTAVVRILRAIEKIYGYDHYAKMSGLSKFFDGYDNLLWYVMIQYVQRVPNWTDSKLMLRNMVAL